MIRITIQNDDNRIGLDARTAEHGGEPYVRLRDDNGDPHFGGHGCTWQDVMIEIIHSGWEIVDIRSRP